MDFRPRFAAIRHFRKGLISAVLLVLTAILATSASSPSPDIAPVWATYGGRLLWQIDPTSHATLRSVPLGEAAQTLAVDPYDRSLWVLTRKHLLQYSNSGVLTVNVALDTTFDVPGGFGPGNGGGQGLGALLAQLNPFGGFDNDDGGDAGAAINAVLNPYGGNLWVGIHKTLLRLNPQGSPDVVTNFPDAIRDVALGLDETLWVLTKKELLSLSSSGQILSRQNLVVLGFTALKQPRALAVDKLGRTLWLVGPRVLAKLDTATSGLPVLINPPMPPLISFVAPPAINAFSGDVWIPAADRILVFNRQGALVRTISVTPFVNKPRSITFEPQTQTFWLDSTNGALTHYAASGQLLGNLTLTNSRLVDGLFGVMPAQILPTVKLTSPASGSRVNNAHPPIHLALGASCNSRPCDLGADYISSLALNISLNGQAIPSSAWTISGTDAAYSPGGSLAEGINTLGGTVTDFLNHDSLNLSDSFIVDMPPVISVTSPINGSLTRDHEQTLLGFVSEPAQLTLNGAPLSTTPPNQLFNSTLVLVEGVNNYHLVATDVGGNQAEYSFTVTLDSVAPAPATVDISEIVDGKITVSGTAEAGAHVTATNLRTGASSSVVVGPSGAYSALLAVQGGDQIKVVVTDPAGNTSEETDKEVPGGLPPDPTTVAPPVDRTVASSLATNTAFLYTGSNPIQAGVEPDTILPVRAAVMRGKVLARNNTPLTGVTISIHNHPEFGHTFSRADGAFDMAVNGGGYLTIDYAKPGYLSAQRQIKTRWQDFVIADDVVLIPLDGKVTTIALGAGVTQVAQGNPVTDGDGTRTATVIFPAGTQATMTLPDGTIQALTTLNVRATEYTVGSNGPAAMPAPLPPTSAYTYAVELSADEAVVAGAKDVSFNQPVSMYVDNFLNFPVGGSVPVGYYDRDRGAWIPIRNGKVIKILSIVDGSAVLDTDGDGNADEAPQLDALGITDAERAQLAGLYAAGKTLWRVSIEHFTPFDCNWPGRPPADAVTPSLPEPGEKDQTEDDPCNAGGSIIECQNQTLGERVPIVGTPFTLNYRSDRVAGRKNTFSIPLSGANVPASLLRIDLRVQVAGSVFRRSFAATPNQVYVFEWDGVDGYGRHLQGAQTASVAIDYVYRPVYTTPADIESAFAVMGGDAMPSRRIRTEGSLTQQYSKTITASNEVYYRGLGGWSISEHHVYDPLGRDLYLGNGERRSAQNINPSITTATPLGGDDVAVGADGSFYVVGSVDNYYRIMRVDPNGTVTVAAGIGTYGFSGDGGPATQAELSGPKHVALGPDGSVYIVDAARVRRIGLDGIITTVAGDGSYGFGGDGGPATEAQIFPESCAIGPDGSLYIADRGNHRIRRVGTDGLISTVVGTGVRGFSGDDGPAINAKLNFPEGITVGPDGTLYIADTNSSRIRRVTSGGTITTMPTLSMSLPTRTALGVDGSLYIADGGFRRVRRLSADGTFTTVAGSGQFGLSSEGVPALQARFRTPRIAVGPDGNLYIANTNGQGILRLDTVLKPYTGNDIAIVSADGAELYEFDEDGRHLRTLNAKTRAIVYSFGYMNSRLAWITDGDGNMTQIVRDASGYPQAIVSPDGARTDMALDAQGYLASITNPANESYRMTYGIDGLLSSFTDPRDNASLMQYDVSGFLIRDENAASGFWNISRTNDVTGRTVRMTSAEGLVTKFQIENLSSGAKRRTNTMPDGTKSISFIGADSVTSTTAPDGTVTTQELGPDPRFGMQAPLPKSTTVSTPNGLTYSRTMARTVTLSNPADLRSLVTQTDTSVVNGKTTRSVYTAATRQYLVTSPMGRQTETVVDTQGRPVQVTVAGLAPLISAYDSRGRLTSLAQVGGMETRSSTFAYDAQGNIASITDNENRVRSFAYDPAGRAIRQTLPGDRTIQWAYDANGNVTSVTPPSRPAHSFGYTPVDLAEQYMPPPAPGVTAPATQYTYNRDKQITRITQPDGLLVDFGYDATGRVSTVSLPGRTVNYAYAATTGNLSNVSTSEGIALAYTYDGALPTEEIYTGNVAGSIERSYDNNFRPIQLTVNGGAITFGYDNDGLLTQAGSLVFTRDAQNGLITGTTLGNTATSQGYNAFGELQQFSAAQAGSSLFNVQYERDPLGRISSKTETIDGETSTYHFDYDAASRLTSVSKDGVVQESYSYDANGNRVGGTYDDQDRLLAYGGNTYGYTSNGELQTKAAGSQTTTYSYDVLGNLVQATLPDGTTLGYVIDGRNRRIGKKINGALVQGFLYQDQLRVAAELDGSNQVVSRFVYGMKPNVPEYMVKGGATYRIITDHLGSVRLVINAATGSVVQRIDYDAFGIVTLDTSPGFQPFGFAGGLYDGDTKLTRFGARDYDAEAGRWTAKDPIGFKGGDSNMYAYVGNNPINSTDPSGLLSVDVDVPGIGTVPIIRPEKHDVAITLTPTSDGVDIEISLDKPKPPADKHSDDFCETPNIDVPIPKGPLKKLEDRLKDVSPALLEKVHDTLSKYTTK